MKQQIQEPDTRDRVMDEELADVLTAISVVSKRLARKLKRLSKQADSEEEGENQDE